MAKRVRHRHTERADQWMGFAYTTAPHFDSTHTIWGSLAEPQYGGNREYAGWRVVQYPGGRHKLGGYTPAMMAGTEKVEAVWGETLPRGRGETEKSG